MIPPFLLPTAPHSRLPTTPDRQADAKPSPAACRACRGFLGQQKLLKTLLQGFLSPRVILEQKIKNPLARVGKYSFNLQKKKKGWGESLAVVLESGGWTGRPCSSGKGGGLWEVLSKVSEQLLPKQMRPVGKERFFIPVPLPIPPAPCLSPPTDRASCGSSCSATSLRLPASLRDSAHPSRSPCPPLPPLPAVGSLRAHPPPSLSLQFQLPLFSFEQMLFWLIMKIIPVHCTAPI